MFGVLWVLVAKTFPVVYARPASLSARTAQALMDPKEARAQLYVDDPAISLVGTEKWARTEGTVPLLWWLVLGLKLAWKKGYFGSEGPTMELPPAYLEQTLDLLRPPKKFGSRRNGRYQTSPLEACRRRS